MRGWHPRRRPPWWPEGERWPPRRRRWSHRGPPPVMRLGCLFGLLLTAAYFAFLLVAVTRLPGGWLAAGLGVGLVVVLLAIIGLAWLRWLARAFRDMGRRLEAAEARRRSVLADVTHELLTPLTIIRGQVEGIADGVYPADAEHLAPILEATRTLELLTEDLRTLALSEAGALRLDREPLDLPVLINDVLASFRPAAEAAGVTISAEVPADLPLVEADPARIRGVLQNLVSNALRHTPAGGSITVAAGQAGGSVQISVRDTGEGIPAELLPRVFDRFVKSPGSPGSGLGLAIARDVVEAHGGSIRAESRPGAGTLIRFDLPLAAR